MGTFNSTHRANTINITVQDIQLQEIRSLRSPLMEREGLQLKQTEKNNDFQTKQNVRVGQEQSNQIYQIQITHLSEQNRSLISQSNIVNFQQQRGISQSDLQLNSDDQYIEIPIPQFILRDSFLLFWFRRIDREFSQLVEFFMHVFMGMYYISLVMPIGFVLVTIFITSPNTKIYSDSQLIDPVIISQVSCLAVKHFFSMNNWMIIDAILTIFVFMFLFANLFYQKCLKKPHKRKIKKIKRKILSTWVIIFSIKYFLWNLLGTMEYFNHIRLKFSCSDALDLYIQVQLLYNYLCIIPLSIFALSNLV